MSEKNTKGRIRYRVQDTRKVAKLHINERETGRIERLEQTITRCVPDHNKQTFLSEATCLIAIIMEDKYGIVAPYLCRHCYKYHMTSKDSSVRKFYRERKANRARIRSSK